METTKEGREGGLSVMEPNLTCPTCGVELMEHGSEFCLAKWFYTLTGWRYIKVSKSHNPDYWHDEKGRFWYVEIVNNLHDAYHLMEWVWEQTPAATIHKDRIEIDPAPNNPHADSVQIISGETFPVRVCRAAIWLASQGATQ